jgi:rhamnose utilization protein RhaD (predicted bifunctional aldolase and dehydrogenase)/NAD(P)-dependent dehydrogenase (short-subunit alcohol dehydrogenase family)
MLYHSPLHTDASIPAASETASIHEEAPILNRWSDSEAAACGNDPLSLRVYTSRLLGADESLVLHGGGNTSVKAEVLDFFGEPVPVLWVKGSGSDLATIEASGFSPVRLDVLARMAEREHMTDTEMVTVQRTALLDPYASNPSVEAILHGIIPFRFVDHTHADAVVTITNTADGERRIHELYGPDMLVVPYVMPGFVLARRVWEMTRDFDWDRCPGFILMNHGVFTFADDPRESYTRMIDIVDAAERYLDSVAGPARNSRTGEPAGADPANERNDGAAPVDLLPLARLRRAVSDARGRPVIALLDDSEAAVSFASVPAAESLATRGPLTPDHVIRTKRTAMIAGEDARASVEAFSRDYTAYFERNHGPGHTRLDPAPRWAVWPRQGTIAFGDDVAAARVVSDIARHTCAAIVAAERLGGWKALPESDIFEVEYWDLEQAKLRKSGAKPEFAGRIALVTGAGSGIGRACVDALVRRGAVVAALDIDDASLQSFRSRAILPVHCDVTSRDEVVAAVRRTVRAFGGLDIVISNAGNFPASHEIESLPADVWERSLALNLTSHEILLQASTPFLRTGVDPAVVLIASKNVPAPGPGAAAYSVAKAGATQLARIAALELGAAGVRVNVLHPNAVFDTGIWSEETLQKRAASYGLTVEAYKRDNVLRTEVTSADVGELACVVAGRAFACTTGAQIPIDGGNIRVI